MVVLACPVDFLLAEEELLDHLLREFVCILLLKAVVAVLDALLPNEEPMVSSQEVLEHILSVHFLHSLLWKLIEMVDGTALAEAEILVVGPLHVEVLLDALSQLLLQRVVSVEIGQDR